MRFFFIFGSSFVFDIMFSLSKYKIKNFDQISNMPGLRNLGFRGLMQWQIEIVRDIDKKVV